MTTLFGPLGEALQVSKITFQHIAQRNPRRAICFIYRTAMEDIVSTESLIFFIFLVFIVSVIYIQEVRHVQDTYLR